MIKLGQMVLKGVNWVHNNKIRFKWSWKESIVYTMIKFGQMVLKGVNWVHSNKGGSLVGQMVLKGVNRVHNDKTALNGLERSQLGTQW